MSLSSDEIAVLRELLGRLPSYLENNWNDLGDGRAFFGDGGSGENGIRTNANVVFAIAVLLKHADTCGVSSDLRADLTGRLRALVRYLVNSHVDGTGTCANGGRWGVSWQSSWWATKLALGADIAGEALDPGAHEAVRQLIAREADRHLDRLIPTGLVEDTKAEETAWDAEALAAALSLNPGSDHAARWRQRLVEFSVNTFSRPSDRNNRDKVDGVVIGDVLRSVNIHEDGSIENHGAAHFGYVASPLLSKAWCAYALRRKGETVPEALGLNVDHVWAFTEPTFLENRFAYIGGQDWARYAYGEYFILPALPYLASIDCGARTGAIFQRRLRVLRAEAEVSDDGSFYGARFTGGRYSGQFAKYETDCFACVALSLEMLDQGGFGLGPVELQAPAKTHISHESLTCYSRENDRFFSFSWRTLTTDLPNIAFAPVSDDSLVEWSSANLLGSVRFAVPRGTIRWVGIKAMEARDAGLRIEGFHALRTANGQTHAEHRLALELNGDVLHVSSRYTATRRLPAVLVTGIDWSIPNDFFNGHERRYYSEGADNSVACLTSATRDLPVEPVDRGLVARLKRKLKLDSTVDRFGSSRWLNVDDRVGIVQRGTGGFTLRRSGWKTAPWNSLAIERIEAPAARWLFNVQPGTTLLESEFTIHLGSHAETRKLAEAGGGRALDPKA